MKKIFIASDHAGVEMKKALTGQLKKKGYKAVNLGTDSALSVDYPDYAKKLARAVKAHRGTKGILICGAGIGMSMAANKIKGIRAALCYDLNTARLSRMHNDANILCLGARTTKLEQAKKILSVWLKTEFEGGRHIKRVKKIG